MWSVTYNHNWRILNFLKDNFTYPKYQDLGLKALIQGSLKCSFIFLEHSPFLLTFLPYFLLLNPGKHSEQFVYSVWQHCVLWWLSNMFFTLLFFKTVYWGERQRNITLLFTYLCVHWLIFVCALTGDQTCNLGVTDWHSNQLSHLARAFPRPPAPLYFNKGLYTYYISINVF